jgi:glutaredoxin 2
MAAALKRLHLQETVLLEDDSETMINLVGKRVVPILVKDDGQPMLESMDMVAYIDGLGTPILVGPQRSELAAWATATADKSAPLTWPRYPLLGLPEFGTIAAHDHYVIRKRKRLGDFVELRAMTREYIDALIPNLETLDRLIESPTAVNGKLSLDVATIQFKWPVGVSGEQHHAGIIGDRGSEDLRQEWRQRVAGRP